MRDAKHVTLNTNFSITYAPWLGYAINYCSQADLLLLMFLLMAYLHFVVLKWCQVVVNHLQDEILVSNV